MVAAVVYRNAVQSCLSAGIPFDCGRDGNGVPAISAAHVSLDVRVGLLLRTGDALLVLLSNNWPARVCIRGWTVLLADFSGVFLHARGARRSRQLFLAAAI